MIRVSVITPVWNRASLVSRVAESVARQEGIGLEWVVFNDGSTDNCTSVLDRLAAYSTFPITIINSSVRVGKSVADNTAIERAVGEFVVWCDSDDYLLPDSLVHLLSAWDSLSDEAQEKFIGVCGLVSENGKLKGASGLGGNESESFGDFLSKVDGDSVIMLKRQVLLANPFLEVDFLIPESSVWCKLGREQVAVVPEAIKEINYRCENGISFSVKIEYCLGRARAIAETRIERFRNMSTLTKLRNVANYIRYCLHGDVSVVDIYKWWGKGWESVFLTVMIPFGYSYYLRDKIFSDVVKTHKTFRENIKQASFVVSKFNY